ncbi:MAG TPA: DUF72 domain-containing protein [Rhizomicrobium sp.]
MSAKRDRAVFHIGTAGWSIRAEAKPLFGEGASHLHRYATRFNAVEINSSFYRPHRPATYARWAASVPNDFRFAVKVPRQITHEARLRDCAAALNAFIEQVDALGPKLGPLLVQLPPSLAFDVQIAPRFFTELRSMFDGLVALEPRHASWFGDEAEDMLLRFQIARVAADPAPFADAVEPGGWRGLVYVRLHGSPRMYYSRYETTWLEALAAKLRAMPDAQRWCIFDNTAAGEAATNAFEMTRLMRTGSRASNKPHETPRSSRE